MNFEIIVLAITGLLIANAYYDGKYLKLLLTWKKYYQMAFIGFMGLSIYWFMKKNPQQSQGLVSSATNFIKYMPIDKEAASFLTPLMKQYPIMSQQTQYMPNCSNHAELSAAQKMSSSGKTSKRSVSETKKKYVASQQQWRCGDCQEQLTAWFEVDHKHRLDKGGTNELNNLIALCRNCHGKKTAMENL